MTKKTYPYRLLTPGPVPLAPEVLKALSEPVRHHRTPEFQKILLRSLENLKWFFATAQPVMMLAATGSGAMEAALVNTLSPGDEILVIVMGKFGERWAEMGEHFGMKVRRLNVPWGESVNLDTLKIELLKNKQLKAVLTQGVETSTATVADIKEISKLVHEHSEALLLVDAITGLGAMPLPMDEWKLDVVVAGSQKALMLPTGLSFIALSSRAWERTKNARTPRYYFDLSQERKANEKGQTYFSSANSHVVALDVVLEKFKKQNLKTLQARCALLAEATRESGKLLGFSVYSKSPAPSVTALQVPDSVDGAKLRDHLEQTYNVTVMGGQDQLAGKILRIGHLGYITDDDLTAGMELVAQSLNDLGYKVDAAPALKVLKATLAKGPHVS